MTNTMATIAICAALCLGACGASQTPEPTVPSETPLALPETADPGAAPSDVLPAPDGDPETTEEVIETSAPL